MRKLLRRPDVESLTGLSRSAIYALVAKGEFPAPVNIVPNGRSVAWLADEIEEWVESRIEASRPTARQEA